MADETLGASFGIDITDLKAGLAQANRLIRESESEFRAAAAGMEDWTESQEGLEARQKSLNRQIDIQKEKVSALTKEKARIIAEMKKEGKTAEEIARATDTVNNAITRESKQLDKLRGELNKADKALTEYSMKTDVAEAKTKDMANTAAASSGKMQIFASACNIAVASVAAVAAACVAGVGAFLGLAEGTRESRNEMAKLETSFQTAGLSAVNAEKTFAELYGILGDEGAAVEAAQQLAKISKDEKDLAANTRILTGVMAEYGTSIPLEGLAEGIAASSAMSSVQGVLADALEWQGVNLDQYNEKLASLATEEERAAYIQSTLTDLYGDSADAYRKNNAEVIAAQEAQAGLNQALNDLGVIAEPIMTTLKVMATDLLTSITPFVSLIGEGLTGALNGAEGAAKKISSGLGGIANDLLGKVTSALPIVADVAVNLVTTLLNKLAEILPDIAVVAVDLVVTLATAILQSVPLLISTIGKVATTLASGIGEALPSILQALSTALRESVPIMADALLNLVSILLGDVVPSIVTEISAILPELLSSIVTLVPNLVTGLLSVLPSILQALLDSAITLVGSLLGTAFPGLLTSIVGMIPELMTSIISFISSSLPILISAILSLLTVLMRDIMPGLITAITALLPELISGILEMLPEIISALLVAVAQLLPALAMGVTYMVLAVLTKTLPQLVAGVVKMAVEMVGAFVNFFATLPEKVAEILMNIGKALLSWTDELLAMAINVGEFVYIVVDFFRQLPGKLETIFVNVISKVISWASQLKAKGASAAKNLLTSITDGIKSLPEKVKTIGVDMIKGLWNGITDMTSWLIGKLDGFGESVLGGIRKFFGIESPSKVMADIVGKNLALGIGKGFTDNIGEVNRDVEGAFNIKPAPTRNVAENGSHELASGSLGSVVVNQYNTYSQPHSRYEIWQSKQDAAAAVKLAMMGG